MAQVSIKLILAYILGIPISVFAFVTNIDVWQKAVLFILISVYWGGMIYFGFRRKRRLEKKEKLEIRMKEIEVYDKETELLKKHKF